MLNPLKRQRTWQDDPQLQALQQANREKYFKLHKNSFLNWAYADSTPLQPPEVQLPLQHDHLAIKLLAQNQVKARHHCVVQSIDVSLYGSQALSCGLDKTVKLWSVNEEQDIYSRREVELEKSIIFDGIQLQSCGLLKEDQEIVACGTRKYIATYDLNKSVQGKVTLGKYTSIFQYPIRKLRKSQDQSQFSIWNHNGSVLVLNSKSKQVSYNIEMSEQCLDAVIKDGLLYTASSAGNLNVYDFRSRRLLKKIQDDGSLKSTSLAISQNGILAAGSDSGIVNIYQYNKQQLSYRKSIENLTTSITGLFFCSNKKLLYYSKWKPNALRMLNALTLTTFSNWPNVQTRLKLVSAGGFDSKKSRVWLGNDQGKVAVYNLSTNETN